MSVTRGPTVESDPVPLRELYYQVGVAMHAAQMLEYQLKLVFWYLAKLELAPFSLEHATELIEGRARGTSGKVWASISRHVELNANAERVVSTAVRSRNRFVHGFLAAHVEDILDAERRSMVLEYVRAIVSDIAAANDFLTPLTTFLKRRAGVDPTAVDPQIREALFPGYEDLRKLS